MKELFKKIGKFLIALDQKDESDIRQKVLLVDGSFILPNNLALIVTEARKKFGSSRLTVLTFEDKEEFIKDNFPDVEVVFPDTRFKKYQLAIQLFLLSGKKFNFVILSSLDISLVLITLMFCRCPVFLLNKWIEWYRLRQRTVLDVLRGQKDADTKRRRNSSGLKEILKSFGRVFITLSVFDEKDIQSRILIEDNGYTETGHLITLTRKAKELFLNPAITVLTFEERKRDFLNNFLKEGIIYVDAGNKRRALAMQMFKIRKNKFSHIILSSLDISPLMVYFLCFKGNILLYNRWHQWWILGFRNIFGYFKAILSFLFMVPVSVYLLITSAIILVRTIYRIKLEKLKAFIKEGRHEAA